MPSLRLLRASSRFEITPSVHTLHTPYQFGSSQAVSRLPTTFSRPLTQSLHIRSQQPPKPTSNPSNPSIPTTSLKETLKDLKGPARWVVIGSLAVLATAESTFWAKVLHAKYFAKDDDKAADEFLERCWEAVGGYRKVWLPNYRGYYAATLWGL